MGQSNFLIMAKILNITGLLNLLASGSNYNTIRLLFIGIGMIMTPFFRTGPLWYHKFEKCIFFGQETYNHFVAQETRVVPTALYFFRSFFTFFVLTFLLLFSNRNDRWHHRLTLFIIFFEFLDVSLSKTNFFVFFLNFFGYISVDYLMRSIT